MHAEPQEIPSSTTWMDAFFHVNTWLNKRLEEDLAKADFPLTSAQFHLARLLHLHGPLTIGEIADMLSCTAPTASGIVDRLEKQNLAFRARLSKDKRIVYVLLSEQGSADLSAFMQRWTKQMEADITTWTNEETHLAWKQALLAIHQKQSAPLSADHD
ncbi:MarR family winged helix-turn-helix transcriptional regulator [Marinicrinis sediminis]|uniref:MarR family winged helix-turn-helix transcriptional regulator n=1 Tax=Marinicrinis sediminis TaxID=1652465 RepID=A0ABW5R851_9BACL